MSNVNVALLSAPTTILSATTVSSNAQLATSSDFLEFKNAGTSIVFVNTARTQAEAIATITWTNPTSAAQAGTMTPILPGEIAVYRHSSRSATDVPANGLWVSGITATGSSTLYITPVQGK